MPMLLTAGGLPMLGPGSALVTTVAPEVINVSNAAGLMTELGLATGGERIKLAAGDYGAIAIEGVTAVTFPTDVTITSADRGDLAIIRELEIDASSHLVFDRILFSIVGSSPPIGPFTITDSTYIQFRNSVVVGYKVPSEDPPFEGEYGFGYGFNFEDSAFIVIKNNDISFCSAGVFIKRSTNATIRANDIHTLGGDGMDMVSVDGMLIEGNWIRDFNRDPASGSHPDMIQFWPQTGEIAPRNVTIRGNFIDAGAGDYTQCIFMNTNLELGSYKNIIIEDNVIYNDTVNGIMVKATDRLTIRNNTILHDPAVIGNRDFAPQLKVLGDTYTDTTIDSNITQEVATWEAMTAGMTVTNNLFVNPGMGEDNYYGDLFVAPFASPASLADLRALANGVIENNAHGAAMTRANIPMVVGPV